MESEQTQAPAEPVVTDKRRLSVDGEVIPGTIGVDEVHAPTDEVAAARPEKTPAPQSIAEVRRKLLSRFSKGHRYVMDGVIMEVKKSTQKDLVLRPVGFLAPKVDRAQAQAATPGDAKHG